MRRTHLALGLATGLLVLAAAVTGLLLQYPHLLGRTPVTMTAFVELPGREGCYLRGTDVGLQASQDGGATWDGVPMLMPPGPVLRIVLDPARPEVLYVLGRDGLVLSRDGGRIWEPLDPGPPPGPAWMALIDLSLHPDGTVDLVTGGGFWRTRDGAATWTAHPVTPPPMGSGMHRLVHDLHTGFIAGRAGQRVVTGGAAALVLLVITGFLLALGSRNRRNGRG
ncbi:hypothetical protein KJ682_09690 [bacterium]|nr:hypothetical protein [bacterium]